MSVNEFLIEDQGDLDISQQKEAFNFEAEITPDEKARIRKEVKRLSVLSPFKSIGAIMLNWIIIVLSIFLSLKIANAFFTIIIISIIGTRQHALLLLMHDGS